jgi:hypothetical protein
VKVAIDEIEIVVMQRLDDLEAKAIKVISKISADARVQTP